MLSFQRICILQNRKLAYNIKYTSQLPILRALTTGSNSKNKTTYNYENLTERRYNVKLLAAIGIGSGLSLWLKSHFIAENEGSHDVSDKTEIFGQFKLGLPEYSAEEVSKHSTLDSRVWVSYRNGVYDITDFISKHPGGDKIMLGAGGSVEPFWVLYAVHKTDHVLKLFEKYRIGNLKQEDVGSDVKNMDDPFANEPKRHVLLKPSSKQPFNAEPPPALLSESLLTPNEFFYVRNHLPVPEVDEQTYELDIEGLDIEEKTLTLQDIKKFPKHTVTAAIQCGGNRRSEMHKVKQVKGLSWSHAAISNAEWTGARLCDVLKAAGVTSDTKALHVEFEGLDVDPTNMPFAASIPIEKAIDPRGDVILAYEMNGVPIPRDHGFPIRVVVPGAVGARSVKWLGRIIVSDEECQSHWQQNDYKGFAPNIDWDTVDFSKSPAIQDMPVTSAICSPTEEQKVKVKDGKVEVRGYAYSGGGRKIIRVDVSGDGGKNWQAADELVSDPSKHPQAWGWTLFRAFVPVPEGKTETELVVKAIDSSYNSQPKDFADIWNLRGVLSNAYHRIKVHVKN